MVSVRVAVTMMTLVTLCLLITNTSAAFHGCCMKNSRVKIPFPVIVGYSVQTVTEVCPINAIIFHTHKRNICVDPALGWVMDYINRLRSKAQLVHFKRFRGPK